MSDPREQRPVRVLQSFGGPRPTTNPYLVQLLDSLPADVRARTFSWRDALRGDYDVLHVHWPELLVRSAGRGRTALRRLAFTALMLRLLLRRSAVVRTLHNVSPHEGGSASERALLRWLDRSTTRYVRLNPATEPPTAAPVDTILHGDYTRWYADQTVPDPVPGRVLHFGLVRPYKGVEELLDAFAAVTTPGAQLRLVGRATDDGLAARIRAAERTDARVSTLLDYVDDETLAHEVGSASLVVLPYRRMHNSGALLLALSLGRPVLVPSNEVTEALAQEVGGHWVRTYPGDAVTTAAVEEALSLPVDGVPGPDLSRRDWTDIGRLHRDTYRAAVTARRAG
ncbi:glycosyltransferase [Cellulomonas aerilata]|uniref:GDP-mannose:glycolipid 4-beta-D-mannosyltransferase n=1 Tax=Cellulomonas aerilata TaxID=515326 RepID=A0A512DDU4_9CELL|nr:glycosyltransferase [Cellulomonas aerilata]GEO34644.1 GDP-mannose:glycolipid 4-beta-D-mannosyltransferase [Cellulomonas aerilata]